MMKLFVLFGFFLISRPIEGKEVDGGKAKALTALKWSLGATDKDYARVGTPRNELIEHLKLGRSEANIKALDEILKGNIGAGNAAEFLKPGGPGLLVTQRLSKQVQEDCQMVLKDLDDCSHTLKKEILHKQNVYRYACLIPTATCTKKLEKKTSKVRIIKVTTNKTFL